VQTGIHSLPLNPPHRGGIQEKYPPHTGGIKGGGSDKNIIKPYLT